MLDEDWIGFDFDGTLARDDNVDFPALGEPIQPMVNLMKKYIILGTKVKVVTARMSDPNPSRRVMHRRMIQEWLAKHVDANTDIEITCMKDFRMKLLYDDRARQVIRNKGVVVENTSENS